MIIEYYNLTRGVHCITGETPKPYRYCRIQSTHCEAKCWEHVIYGAGPDLLMKLALGHEIVVHDQSERLRETRAVWQGVAFIKRACEIVWGRELTPIVGRGSLTMERYFDSVIMEMSSSLRNYIRYYRQFGNEGSPVWIHGCNCKLAKVVAVRNLPRSQGGTVTGRLTMTGPVLMEASPLESFIRKRKERGAI